MPKSLTMIKVFVSGCYDIIHAGHIQFFQEARALGHHLTVCFASDDVLWHHKGRRSSLPQAHKQGLIAALSMVDDVVIGENNALGLDFQDHFRAIKPDILAVTEDDQYEDLKKQLCAEVGAQYFRLPKTPPQFKPISTTGIVKWIKAPNEAPLRVDFAGGWLDVPRFSREGAFVVNCAISPTVTLRKWDYEQRSGLGGSGAWAMLNGENGIGSELDMGVGWQDPAVIFETGLCVWRSGKEPRLTLKRDGKLLRGHMALYYTGQEHDTPAVADKPRDFDKIEAAGKLAAQAVEKNCLHTLAEAVECSYQVQLDEGMEPLEAFGSQARKYCGGGFGGYAVYLFAESAQRDAFVSKHSAARAIEPFLRVFD